VPTEMTNNRYKFLTIEVSIHSLNTLLHSLTRLIACLSSNSDINTVSHTSVVGKITILNFNASV